MTTKTVSEETKAKIKAANDAKAAMRVATTIDVSGYKVFRMDDLNWCIEHKGNLSYFSTLAGCMESLFEKLAGQRVGGTLESILSAIASARTDIRTTMAKYAESAN